MGASPRAVCPEVSITMTPLLLARVQGFANIWPKQLHHFGALPGGGLGTGLEESSARLFSEREYWTESLSPAFL